jgi:hypothetical protein
MSGGGASLHRGEMEYLEEATSEEGSDENTARICAWSKASKSSEPSVEIPS